jgi:hypothetical protein
MTFSVKSSAVNDVSGHLSTMSQDITMERATGIEPALSAWEADVMPLHYAREWLYWVSIERDGRVANHVAK